MRALIISLSFLCTQDPEPDAKLAELRGQLKDETANVRERAVRELTKLNAREAAPDIRPLLKDPEWGVRYASLIALTQFDDREAAGAAKELLKDPEPSIIVAAILAHSAWSSDAGLEDLGPLLKHADADVRRVATIHLGTGGNAKAGKGVIELLKDPDRRVAIEAVRACGALGLQETFEAILPCIGSEDPELKAAALEAVKWVGRPDKHLAAVKELIEQKRAGPEVWAVAAYWGDRDALPWFAEDPANRPLWILNRIASPEAALKLRTTRIDRRDLKNATIPQILDQRLARRSGLSIEWDPSAPPEKHSVPMAGWEALGRYPTCEAVLVATGLGWVADGAKVRILSREAQLTYWKAWLADQKDK